MLQRYLLRQGVADGALFAPAEEAEGAEALVAAHLVGNLVGDVCRLLVGEGDLRAEALAEPPRQLAQRLPGGPSLAGHRLGGAQPLHPAVGVGEGAVFAVGGRVGQHHVGLLRGVGEQLVDHQQEVELAERLLHEAAGWREHERVIAHDYQRLDLAPACPLDNAVEIEAYFPLHGLASGTEVGRYAHVARAVNVRFARQQVEGAGCRSAAQQQRDVGGGLRRLAGQGGAGGVRREDDGDALLLVPRRLPQDLRGAL